jgi:predicted lactoylglutathione lyase
MDDEMPTSPRAIFLNLPVGDLRASVAFFTALGFEFDPRFTDENAACMVVNDDAFVMLLVQHRFADFTTKAVCDATTSTEAIIALSADSRAEVDDLVHRALAAGGRPANDPIDHGFMYGWSFQDLDGHLWELVFMEPNPLDEPSEGWTTPRASMGQPREGGR